MRRGVVVIFARYPRLGVVKTRLAAGIGRRAARQFYIETTGTVIRRLQNPKWDLCVAITPDSGGGISSFWPTAPTVFSQGQGDLGARMERAMMRFENRPAVIVGSDIPDLDGGHVAAAFDALGQHEYVFGPADDGGYWLVGARRGALARGLFKNVRWSGPHALADTLANTGKRRTAMLDQLDDIDTIEDLRRWQGG